MSFWKQFFKPLLNQKGQTEFDLGGLFDLESSFPADPGILSEGTSSTGSTFNAVLAGLANAASIAAGIGSLFGTGGAFGTPATTTKTVTNPVLSGITPQIQSAILAHLGRGVTQHPAGTLLTQRQKLIDALRAKGITGGGVSGLAPAAAPAAATTSGAGLGAAVGGGLAGLAGLGSLANESSGGGEITGGNATPTSSTETMTGATTTGATPTSPTTPTGVFGGFNTSPSANWSAIGQAVFDTVVGGLLGGPKGALVGAAKSALFGGPFTTPSSISGVNAPANPDPFSQGPGITEVDITGQPSIFGDTRGGVDPATSNPDPFSQGPGIGTVDITGQPGTFGSAMGFGIDPATVDEFSGYAAGYTGDIGDLGTSEQGGGTGGSTGSESETGGSAGGAGGEAGGGGEE